MIREENSAISLFLLSAFAMTACADLKDSAGIRDAIQKALHSKELAGHISLNPGLGKRVQHFLANFSLAENDAKLGSLPDALPPDLNSLDEKLCRLLVNFFFLEDCRSLDAAQYLDSLSILSDQSRLIANWFWKLAYTETFGLTLNILAALRKREGATGEDWDSPVREVLAASGAQEHSLPWILAFAHGRAILQEGEVLDDSLDRFLTSSHMPSPSPLERDFLRMALLAESAESMDRVMVKEAIDRLVPGQMNPRLKKFARNGLSKALNSRSRVISFQTLYAFSFNWPKNYEALKREYFLSSEAVIPDSLTSEIQPDSAVWELVSGVWRKKDDLDREIAKFSHKWRVERLGRIELLLLRMGLYEIGQARIPAKVVISEILELADRFGVPEAKSLVNGILDAAIKAIPERQS